MTMHPPRIVSLLPSATEIVAALGLTERLVGRSHACDFPVEVAQLPAMTRPRIAPARPSRGLHRDMRTLVERALSGFEVDGQRPSAARPAITPTPHQCEARPTP